MKRRVFLGCLGVLGVAHMEINAAEAQKKTKSLIIYFSRTGHVEALAKTIAELTGAQMLKVEPIEAYPNAYSETVDIVKEQMNKGIVPAIKPLKVNFDDFDVIYLGSPTWWGHISRPMERFLTDNKFKGKKVMLFTSHGGSGVAHTREDVQRLCSGNDIAESNAFYGGSANDKADLQSWIEKNVS